MLSLLAAGGTEGQRARAIGAQLLFGQLWQGGQAELPPSVALNLDGETGMLDIVSSQSTQVGSALAAPGADLTIVVPTLNERENLEPLLAQVTAALGEVAWQVIFVDDDSADGTADRARTLAQRDARVRCLQRIGRRGLSTACIEGVLASASPYVAVMDGDLQHDERLLPKMLDMLRRNGVDLVIGSRYVAGGTIGEGFSNRRAYASGFATFA